MSKAMDIALKTAEAQVEKELTSKFSARMRETLKDLGAKDTSRHTIVSAVANEDYERAIRELEAYVATQVDYPQFTVRTERYVSYAIDLINATRAKRSFPGLQHLTMSKQQELFDRAMEHFEDLKVTLRKIEQIERDVRLDDIRSTVWVVKAIIYSIFAMLVLGFLIELSRGVLPAASIVADDTFGKLTDKLFDLFGI